MKTLLVLSAGIPALKAIGRGYLESSIKLVTVVLAVAFYSSLSFAASRIEWRSIEPSVTGLHSQQTATLTVQVTGTPAQVRLVYADKSETTLQHESGGRYSIQIPHDKLIWGYTADKGLHNFVGHLDLGTGSKYNLFVNIDDGDIPTVAFLNLDAGIRVSPRIFNILLPLVNTYAVDPEHFTRILYRYFGDEFDFINVVRETAEYREMHFVDVRNSVQGLGLPLFDDSGHYDSDGKLDGVIEVPMPEHLDLASPNYLRMLGYNWMNYSQHTLLQGASPHWPISHLALGIMGYQPKDSRQFRRFPWYFKKEVVGNFLFRYWTGNYVLMPSSSANDDFISMELYLMGLLPAEEDIGWSVLRNQDQWLCDYCVVEGPLDTYDVGNLISRHGHRVPGFDQSQKDFRVATIVVSNDRLLSEQEISFFDHMAARGEGLATVPYSFNFRKGVAKPFREATHRRGSLDAVIARELGSGINYGVSDSWHNPDIPGQGFFVSVLPKTEQMFIGWFTYEVWRPRPLNKQIGDEYHRWFTAQGKFDNNEGELKLYETIGGRFGSDIATSTSEIGDLTFRLKDCSHAEVEFYIEEIDHRDAISLRRTSDDHVTWCAALQPWHESMAKETHHPAAARIQSMTSNGESGASPAAESEGFQINKGLSGAWHNPKWDGQGLFLTVLPKVGQMFAGWFTYDQERPDDSAYHRIGDPGHRWFTAQGSYHGDFADLRLILTSGGEFLSDRPAPQNEYYGTLEIQFSSCNAATVRYEIPSVQMSGEFPLERISDENVELCLQLAEIQQPPEPIIPPHGPVLYLPFNDQVIQQNNPDIGCAYHPQRGYGDAVEFDWSDIDAHSVRYNIIVQRKGAAFPALNKLTFESAYSWISCNGFVLPRYLDNWEWRVQAHITEEPDGPAIATKWSEGRFQFEECRLSDGSRCSAPSVGD